MDALIEDKDDKSCLLFAGEKYFHSCILIMQTIFWKYASEQLLIFPWLSNNRTSHDSILFAAQITLAMLGAMATISAMYGFEELNGFLWKRYSARWYASHSKQNIKGVR